MTPERWSQVREALHGASVIDRAERAEFLNGSCAGDAELRGEVERLLAALDESGGFLEPKTPAKEESGGARIGPYLILDRAGQGGMGTVYRAVREDDYQQQVALKLVNRDIETDFLIERFRRERQALALLNHPNIARLLDGGTTQDGRPYLVMEWVQGSPISDYCAARKLGLRERLGCFETVCHAVAHAHANLVVHRDLKPSNILIADDGAPKLLDFGIAKILTPEPESGAPPLTVPEASALTPDYASPEQVRGEPITTATDIYSLGAVLYELLTGARPHRFQTRTPAEIERVVSGAVTKPSVATGAGGIPAHELRGDLDNIILKAMEKEPARRYLHAEALAADVRLYLEGRPVSARSVSFGYRAVKFVRRNKMLTAMTAAAVLSLSLGLASALWQARAAQKEREIAERRFDLARRVAASLLYDIHDRIEDLVGSSKARELLLGKSVAYLDALSQEAGDSPALEIDLANAYQRVAELQGVGGASNLGEADAAAASLNKAEKLLEHVVAAAPRSVDARRGLATTHRLFVSATHEGAEQLRHAQAALSMVEALRREMPGDATLLDDLQKSEFAMGRAFATLTRFPESAAYYRKAIADSGASSPQNVALAHKSLGAVLIRTGALDKALAEYQAAAAADEARVRGNPDNGRAKLDLSFDYSDWGLILVRSNQSAAAVEKYREAERIRAAMAAADARDARAASSLVSVRWRLGIAMTRAGNREGASWAFQASAAEGERMIAALPDPKPGKQALAEACWNIGFCFKKDWASCAKAKPWLLRARGLFQELNEPTKGVDQALAECGAGGAARTPAAISH